MIQLYIDTFFKKNVHSIFIHNKNLDTFQVFSIRYVTGVCNFLGSVSLQQRFETADQCYSSVTVQSFIRQVKVHPQGVRAGWPQRRGLNPTWLRLFIHFASFLLSLPVQIGLAKKGACSFHLKFSLQIFSALWISFCSIFVGFSPSSSFSHHHFGLFLPILTT